MIVDCCLALNINLSGTDVLSVLIDEFGGLSADQGVVWGVISRDFSEMLLQTSLSHMI